MEDAPLTLRAMAREEISRIRELDLSETGEVVYHWVDGEVRTRPEKWERPPACEWEPHAAGFRAILDRGGAAWGTFDGETLVGFAVLKDRLAEGVAQLEVLWVSRNHRRRGVATALVREAIRRAAEGGADSLYVSSTPSLSAVGFYRSIGFRPTPFVHMEVFREEPDDIHMTLDL